MAVPKVLIVGRMNVGKSTLFNRLAERVKSLTFDYEGVTRDFITDVVSWQGHSFELIDSAGVILKKQQDVINQQLQAGIQQLAEKANVFMLVVDGSIGITEQDRAIAALLRKFGKPVLLVVNKEDNRRTIEFMQEFERLGFGAPLLISATHGTGIGELLDALIAKLSTITVVQHEEIEPNYSVAIIGKPNVGKSSLLNKLLGKERALVTPIAGTTREPIAEHIQFYQETVQLADTPGIRKQHAVQETLEKMMVKTSFKAIDRADIVLLMVDASEGKISDQELKLAFYVFEHHKALILLINKNDLLDEEHERTLEESYKEYAYFLKKIPRLYISCKTGDNLGKILPLIKTVHERYAQQLPSLEIQLVVKEALEHKPLYHGGHLLFVRKAKQVQSSPPTIRLMVNEPTWFKETQLGFIENVLRSHYDLKGVPLRFIVRKAG